jgi:hypothetical protein
MYRGYVERKWIPTGAVTPEQAEIITDYVYMIFQPESL